MSLFVKSFFQSGVWYSRNVMEPLLGSLRLLALDHTPVATKVDRLGAKPFL